MDPLNWKSEQKLALALAFAFGISLGLVLGYLAYAAGAGPTDNRSFGEWLTQPLVGYVETTMGGVTLSGGLAFVAPERFWWGLYGGIVGGAFVYVAQLLRR